MEQKQVNANLSDLLNIEDEQQTEEPPFDTAGFDSLALTPDEVKDVIDYMFTDIEELQVTNKNKEDL